MVDGAVGEVQGRFRSSCAARGTPVHNENAGLVLKMVHNFEMVTAEQHRPFQPLPYPRRFSRQKLDTATPAVNQALPGPCRTQFRLRKESCRGVGTAGECAQSRQIREKRGRPPRGQEGVTGEKSICKEVSLSVQNPAGFMAPPLGGDRAAERDLLQSPHPALGERACPSTF